MYQIFLLQWELYVLSIDLQCCDSLGLTYLDIPFCKHRIGQDTLLPLLLCLLCGIMMKIAVVSRMNLIFITYIQFHFRENQICFCGLLGSDYLNKNSLLVHPPESGFLCYWLCLTFLCFFLASAKHVPLKGGQNIVCHLHHFNNNTHSINFSRNGIAIDRIVGFQDLGGKDDFTTKTLELFLLKKGNAFLETLLSCRVDVSFSQSVVFRNNQGEERRRRRRRLP